MKNTPISFVSLASTLLFSGLIFHACGPGLQQANDAGPSEGDAAALSESFTIDNEGGAMEGHTPRGFQGQGTGLFVGDNLNANFPNGDGVHAFISFSLADVPAGRVQSARFFSENGSVSGTPYQDLGALIATEIEYEAFSSALYNLEAPADAHTCTFGTNAAGPFECDIAPLVQRALDDGRDFAQVRLAFESASDNDGAQDLALFFLTDSNTNEAGIFSLELEIAP